MSLKTEAATDHLIAELYWDVDLQSDDVVRVFRASDPENPTIYRSSQTAEAEPAVPGWTMPVDDLTSKGDAK